MNFDIEYYDTYIVLAILFTFAFAEIIGGFYKNYKHSKDDWIMESISLVQTAVLIQPMIVVATLATLGFLLPEYDGAYKGMSLWFALPFYLLIDDVMQYWYHRKAHEWEWLWKFHRPHHATPEMGVLTTFRNAAIYYVIMPNLWWIGIVTFLGFGKAVAIGLTFKYLVVIGAHSQVKWDQFLYKYKILSPLAWIVERTISTPSTHFTHHGKTAQDGISDPNGNFSNTFFFWDILFGTAIIHRQYPTEFGLENDPQDGWAAHLYYPFIKSKKEGSELSKNYKKTITNSLEPSMLTLEAGKYAWCRCGYSQNQPFCDGSHHGTGMKPLVFEVKRKQKLSLCNCKMTKSGPFCDNSHVKEVVSVEGMS